MKPWEETWVPTDENVTMLGHAGDQFVVFVSPDEDDANSSARAKLAASAPRMARLLLKLEWGEMDGNWSDATYCRACLSRQDEGHEPACEWLATMREAGVRE